VAWFAPVAAPSRRVRRESVAVGMMWRRFDWVALAVTVFLIVVGCVMIYSAYEATRPTKPETLWGNTVFRQAVFALVGAALYLGLAVLDYRVLVSLYKWIYLGTLALLVFTLLIGEVRFGAQRGFDLEYFAIQPAELAKLLMVIVMARLLDGTERNLESIGPFLHSAVAVAAPAVLIYLQPDFGLAMVLMLTWLGVVLLAGVRWCHILMLLGAGLAGIPLVWSQMHDYQRMRIIEFLFPGSDPSGSSYNVTQALISIGSGGWWGKGLLQGTQSQLQFLRVRHTDFIFSVLAEEFGFVGAMLLLILFAVLILRILRVAAAAPDIAGRLIAGGVATMIFVQAFINVGMNAQLLPVTGITLPLISYGGSSLTTTLMGLGLVQSVALRSHRPEPTLLI